MQNGASPDAGHALQNGNLTESEFSQSQIQQIDTDTVGDTPANPDQPQTPAENGETITSPRGTKRKSTEILQPGRDKRISPPWKKAEAEGPTSFVVDGRRKSSRKNAIPLELQPQGNKRQTRGEYSKYLHERDVDVEGEAESPARTATDRRRSKEQLSTPSHPKSTSSGAGAGRKPPVRSSDGAADVQLPNGHASPHTRNKSSRAHFSRHNRNASTQKQSPRDIGEHQVGKTSEGNKSPTHPLKMPRLRLRLRQPTLPKINPLTYPKRHFPSLDEWLAQDDPLQEDNGERREHRLTKSEAREEALTIDRVLREGRPGGVFDKPSVHFNANEASDDPSRSHGATQYISLHAVDLQQRMVREAKEHRRLAKQIAGLAAAESRRRQPQSAEEREEEKRKNVERVRRAFLVELKSCWDQVRDDIKKRKAQEYMRKEAAEGRAEMKKLVDQSEGLLVGRKNRRVSIGDEAQTDAETPSQLGEEDESEASSGGLGSKGSAESDVSMSSSEEDAQEVTADGGDDMLSLEELRKKYAGIPPEEDEDNLSERTDPDEPTAVLEEKTNHPNPDPASEHVDIDPALHQLDEVDEVMLDRSEAESGSESGSDSDSGTDLDSEESGDEGERSESGDDDDIGQAPLLGFFSKKDQGIMKNAEGEDQMEEIEVCDESSEQDGKVETDRGEKPVLPSPEASPIAQEANPTKTLESNLLQPAVAMSTSEEPSGRSSPGTSATDKPQKQESVSSVEPMDHSSPHLGLSKEQQAPKVAIPSLLRGQLREYQHDGFDWLARMYENDTNGILADEMGLGKTIQTIALLAHLATHHHAWGPHLIVVPTSVMLNWEMEFKKFCPGFKILTYYGSQEERRAKRKGWMDNDRWHVCITSYQLALQDAASLKRRDWHYLVLDEAHNIKNFRSQRWQTLLSFKSRARLLLTGTPLQNNLTELWSLLFFLAPEENEEGSTNFGDLTKFSRAFHRPVDQILESGREAMDEEARDIVNKLHTVLRPHLLRRLKADVEKQMPKKYEHVTVCRLSKRQRQLYDEYMRRADTRDSFSSGNYMSIINCLMQLRKVCNHPDLFETRQIVTSFAMPRSAVAEYEIRELFIRKHSLEREYYEKPLHCLNLWDVNASAHDTERQAKLSAMDDFLQLVTADIDAAKKSAMEPDWQTAVSSLQTLQSRSRQSKLADLEYHIRQSISQTQRRPAYSTDLLKRLSIRSENHPLVPSVVRNDSISDQFCGTSSILSDMIYDLQRRSQTLETTVQKFGCITPLVVAPKMAQHALTSTGVELIRTSQTKPTISDPFHEARTRLSIAFPDKSLIQYDCGKLQQLAILLRNLQTHGHRALIFTQMTKVLDILEQFLNLHGHRYLRLDGATKIEQRQILTDRFNNDPRILAFILSSRSGGLGINLTGADTVIFYDLDWNPAMDKQCQDRCHRIGQTRDVHIYRFVSEGTIEANILRKSNQKRMLDDVVIQEGDFTTEYFDSLDVGGHRDDADVEADAALDKVLGGGAGAGAGGGGAENRAGRVLGQAEDREDVEAAREAQKEDVQADVADFDEKAAIAAAGGTTTAVTPAGASGSTPRTPRTTSQTSTPTPMTAPTPANNDIDATAFPVDATTPLPPLAPTDTQTPHPDPQETTPQTSTSPRYTDPSAGDYGSCRLPQDNAVPEGQEPNSFDAAMLRFMEYDMRDYVHVPEKSKLAGKSSSKSKKKGKESGIRIRR
ncbi:MAG: swr1 complex component [Alyxoria varia]|nr:MAG: swr1 complex component [Alyxoria varia]